MPFARGDMRDHIVSHKNDHGASYGRYAVLQWWSRLKMSFCEIFGVVQFSTFATLSPEKRTLLKTNAGDPTRRCHVCFVLLLTKVAELQSITLLARAKTLSGMVRPSAMAVFKI